MDQFPESYARLGPPLRPSSGDIQILERTVADWASAHSIDGIQVLLLGVTPDIAHMRWHGAFGRATSRAPRCCLGRLAFFAAQQASCDVVMGDGAINCLRYPDGFRKLAETVASVLRPDGIFILRACLQSDPPETIDQVFADALQGRISSFHAFKLRLLMAVQERERDGVAVRDV